MGCLGDELDSSDNASSWLNIVFLVSLSTVDLYHNGLNWFNRCDSCSGGSLLGQRKYVEGKIKLEKQKGPKLMGRWRW